MFYRSGLWSLMCSWPIQVMLSEQMYTLTHICASLCFFFFPGTASVTHSHSSPSPTSSPHTAPPSPSPGSLPWQGGQTSCETAVVCRMHSAPGPQALDDNQPNFSHRFSAAWKIHRPICQTWNGLLHSLEFHCRPQTTSLHVTRSLLLLLLLREQTVRPPLLSPLHLHFPSSPHTHTCSFSRTCFSPPSVCWSQELGTGIKAVASFDGVEDSSVDENKS